MPVYCIFQAAAAKSSCDCRDITLIYERQFVQQLSIEGLIC